jgi:intracellular sulfur oxidation DsrE/DsrF family protein
MTVRLPETAKVTCTHTPARAAVRALTARARAAYYCVRSGGRPGRRSEVHMQRSDDRSFSARRSFLSRLGSGFAAVGAAMGAGTASAQAQGTASGGWQPPRHAEDEWFDKIPGKHRTILDAVSARGVGEALHFASNIFTTSKSGYGLENNEVAIVVCLRHGATAFAFNDEIWSKYGASLPSLATDQKTDAAPTRNPYNVAESRRDEAFDALIKLGVHFAVCNKSTQGLSGSLARKTDGKSDAVYKEMLANLIGNSHMVPSGIVAVGHAQEHGYAYAYCG